MSKWKRPRPKVDERGRPSLFFIVAMTLGVLLLVWLFAQGVTRQMKPPVPPRKSALPIVIPSRADGEEPGRGLFRRLPSPSQIPRALRRSE